MAKLFGAQRMVLQAIFDLRRDAASYVPDSQISQKTQITLEETRDWIETLEGEGHLQVARAGEGLHALITAQGKIALKQFESFVAPAMNVTPTDQPIAQSPTSTRTILFLGSNPRDTVKLQLDQEARQIEAGLERARRRDQFKLVTKWAVTDSDLLRALLDHEPEIVHFSGHGGGEEGLKFDNGSGNTHPIPGETLARLFALCSDHVRCVVLNACYAEAQAEAIVQHIDYVIGMSDEIGDEASVRFSVGFYDALGAGRSFEKAFEFGKVAIDLRGIAESQTPVLKKKQR